MSPEELRTKFDTYRKWFHTLLIKEFLNLPVKFQQRFLILTEKFLQDCRKVHEEAKTIKEKEIQIQVNQVIVSTRLGDPFTVIGKVNNQEIIITFPGSMPKPQPGKKLSYTIFSLDGDVWYSSKEELLTGKNNG